MMENLMTFENFTNETEIKEDINSALETALEKASKIAPSKKVNERTQQEIEEARQCIYAVMPKFRFEMSWEEFKPYGVALQKQSSWGQPDSVYERWAKNEYNWGKKRPDICRKYGY